MKKIHIDEIQPSTVDEHFNCLIEDNSVLDPELSDVTLDDLPDWYDEKLYKETQAFYKRNILSVSTQNFIGLLSILSIPSILKVLLYTKKHNTTCAAFKRYLETLLHVETLYKSDINDRDSKWYKTINTIRWKHGTSSKKSQCANVGPIYNRDMVFTQGAFIGPMLTCGKAIGLNNIPDEALTHFWRVNAYMLGIPDRLNLCRKNAKETRDLCLKIRDEVYKKYLSEAPVEFYDTITNTVNGMWHIDPLLNVDSVLAKTFQVYDLKYEKPLGWYSSMNIAYRETIFKLLLVPYIGTIVREYYNYLLTFLYRVAETSPVFAWIAFGKRNSQIDLYPKYN